MIMFSIKKLKNIQNLYLSLPKLHQWFIVSLSVVLLLLIILPTKSALTTKESTPISQSNTLEVGQRYSITAPSLNNTSPKTLSVEPTQKKLISPNKKITTEENTNQLESSNLAVTQQVIEPTIELEETINTPENKPELSWKEVTVKSGDSLAKIFHQNGFNAKTTYNVSRVKGDKKDAKRLLNLNVGDTLHLGKNSTGELIAIKYPLSKTTTLFVDKGEQDYTLRKEEKETEIRSSFANGIITSNFWNAGTSAGLNDAQIINLANVFGWDIDFAIDIRKGDSFHVVYEEKYVEGEFIGYGNILSAEFVNQKDTFQAVRFKDGHYYTPTGNSMRKAFLRAPVNFKYISSNFTRKRFHPISKRWKAHNGTDYRANTGTPVVAAGDGKVTHSTYNKYNGHYVFIQHGNDIVTKYLHFSKRKVKKGQRVKQGQVIGLVGSTGLSQAPHLHYEFLLNGVHRNPRTVQLPDAKPIDKKYRSEFLALAEQRLAELNSIKKTMIVMQQP